MKQGQRFVAHFDMDAFFAAIEERDNPRFAGKPIAVGADPEGGRGRGVVSTANYAARAYGIGSGQAIGRAWQLSQAAARRGDEPVIFLPGSWQRYQAVSRHVMEIIEAAVPVMQQRSVDEAYADLTSCGSLEAAAQRVKDVQHRIYTAERLTVSVGLGANKLVAKVASDYDKPNGFTVVDASATEDFLAPLPVRALPGVGPQTEKRLHVFGITTIGELQAAAYDDLVDAFGRWGEGLWKKSHGVDETPVQEAYVRKSIGEQRTFRTDVTDAGVLIHSMGVIAKEVFSGLRAKEYIGARTVTITVRFADFQTISSAHTYPKLLKQAVGVEREAIRLLLPFLDKRRNPQGKAVRLLGVRLEKLE